MVAKITCPTSLKHIVNYNENKVKQEKASCIHAANYLKDAHQMNIYEKMERIKRNTELSTAETKLLHISLNFDPSDKLDKDKMVAIANDYMQRIGFGNQPYLVYEHTDAGHPHCHIVTTNIRDNGKRIDTFNIGKKVSGPARRAIETEYGLIKADGRKLQKQTKKPEPVQKIQYGQSDTKRSITNVLDAVIDEYKYSSLTELNAVLRLYNVEADRGKGGSRTHEHKGLHYRVIDEQGNKIGVPIKASSIYSKPTLNNLEQKFQENASAKTPEDKKALKTAIDWTLLQADNLKDFVNRLAKDRIDVVVRQNEKGQLYGLTYVDHNNKTVFNGSELGKEYAAKGIQEQLMTGKQKNPEHASKKAEHPSQAKSSAYVERDNYKEETYSAQSGKAAVFSFVENLLKSESGEAVNKELIDAEKGKRRKSFDVDQEHEM